MTGLTDLTLAAMRSGLDRGEFSAEELTAAHLQRLALAEPEMHAYLFTDADGALASARRHDQGSSPAGSALAGIPVALKDIFCTADMPTTCGSRLLEGYRPPYDATLVERLRLAGSVILGKTNMDEFAMGSSCENSGFGPTCNPLDLTRVPGGSSGGAAAAVAARTAAGSYGTDTGGSIRQPAALCGLVGMKPTYGRISRCGMVAFASSLDQAGPLARTVEDAALLLEAVWGHDPLDATSANRPVASLRDSAPLTGRVLGLVRGSLGDGVEPGVSAAVEAAMRRLEAAGAVVEEIDLDHADVAIPAYYLVATAEASANLARYDGVRFGTRCSEPGDDLNGMYSRTRSHGFGDEVQRRILLGTFALAAGYHDAFYRRAQQVRTLIRRDFARAFARVDFVISPTSPVVAFPLGEKSGDPLAMYLTDVFTVPASLAGLPALSLPCGASQGLPVGLQIIGDLFADEKLLANARTMESVLTVPPFLPVAGSGAAAAG